MESDCRYLFVYGTLLDNDNEFGAFLKKHSTYVSKGSFNGLLYDLGEYPGAIYKSDIKQQVHGSILLLNNDPEILSVIDEYEGYGLDEAQPNLFVRELLPVKTTSGVIRCWVYLYNRATSGYRQIPAGRYK
jgi:gamma-glutamylcyclotransferase (GGCT)/AIG2-like uncharacterized protein YtfP